jgi:hypothetical protein
VEVAAGAAPSSHWLLDRMAPVDVYPWPLWRQFRVWGQLRWMRHASHLPSKTPPAAHDMGQVGGRGWVERGAQLIAWGNGHHGWHCPGPWGQS